MLSALRVNIAPPLTPPPSLPPAGGGGGCQGGGRPRAQAHHEPRRHGEVDRRPRRLPRRFLHPTLPPPILPLRPQVWPNGFPETSLVDHWRCRFRPAAAKPDVIAVQYAAILRLMTALHARGLDVIKVRQRGGGGGGRLNCILGQVGPRGPSLLSCAVHCASAAPPADGKPVLLPQPRWVSHAGLLAGPGRVRPAAAPLPWASLETLICIQLHVSLIPVGRV